MKTLIATLMITGLLVSTAAYGQDSAPPVAAEPAAPAQQAPGYEQRQENQQKRIEQGAASGELTQREQKRLERHQKRIDRVVEKAEADGQVTDRERARIHHMQNKASREIGRKKHNRRDRN